MWEEKDISSVVAIDAMGGDQAPEEIVAGALMAASDDIQCLLVGDEARIKPLLNSTAGKGLEIVHTPSAVAMDDSPARGLRRKDSSMAIAARMAREGKAEAVFSAGNTGAWVWSNMSIFDRITGIDKVGIAINLPTQSGKDVLLIDAGASVDCKGEDILGFARMGRIYAREIMGRDNPSIGLMNIGEEAFKGDEASRNAYALLKGSGLNFVGNVEGNAIAEGAADVLVCDGFTGNMILKVAEGTVGYAMGVLRSEFTADFLGKIGASLLKPAFKRIRKRIDWKEWGGGVLLGPKGNVLIGHGRSDAKAVYNAIRLADKMARTRLWERIDKDLVNSEIES